MGEKILKKLFGKKEKSSCCEVEIEEVKKDSNNCCGVEIEEIKEEDNGHCDCKND